MDRSGREPLVTITNSSVSAHSYSSSQLLTWAKGGAVSCCAPQLPTSPLEKCWNAADSRRNTMTERAPLPPFTEQTARQ
jgi:hypothetical protein